MLIRWILILLIVLILNAILGFTGILAPPLLGIVRTLFVIFLVLFVLIVFIHICSNKE